MKKLVSMYQKYMFRPILYKSVTRVSVVAVLMLLWDRYVSDGTFTLSGGPRGAQGALRRLGRDAAVHGRRVWAFAAAVRAVRAVSGGGYL